MKHFSNLVELKFIEFRDLLSEKTYEETYKKLADHIGEIKTCLAQKIRSNDARFDPHHPRSLLEFFKTITYKTSQKMRNFFL